MPYTHFQMIAYEIPTVTNDGNRTISGWDAGTECARVARIPVPDNVTDNDARIRLRRLAQVVDAAWNRHSLFYGPSGSTLKIFIVPEFYFRPDISTHPNNSYADNVANTIFQALDSMFSHSDFNDWMFVCGTVIWDSANDTFAKTKLYFNTAVVVEGGKTNSIRIIEKKLPSGIDGVPPTFYGPGTDPDVKLIFNNWSANRWRIFDISGQPFGLEVCLDHGIGVLKNILGKWLRNEGLPKSLKFHILTAGGMSINANYVAAKRGGYILRNDGHVLQPPPSEMRLVSLAGPLVNVASDSTWPVDTGMRIPIPGGFPSFVQRVVYYPSHPIPF